MNVCRYLIAWCIVSVNFGSAAFAQVANQTISVPKTTIVAAVFYPSKALLQPSAELYPREILTAFGQKEFGIDPLQIELVAAMLDRFDPQLRPSEPRWGIVVRFLKPTVLGGNSTQSFEREEFEGRTGYLLPKVGSEATLRLIELDDRTFFIGEETFLSEMLKPTSTVGTLSELVNADHQRAAFHVFADIAAFRPIIAGAIGGMEVPPALKGILEIPNLARTAHLQIELIQSFNSRLVLTSEPGKAKQMADTVAKGLTQAKEFVVNQLQTQLDLSDPVQQATLSYAMRIGSYFENRLAPELQQDQLAYTADYGISSLPIATALLLPAVQSTRAAARRVDSANRLRQMMLAMHNYHDAFRGLPTDVRDGNGKRLLSWRVQILPFIEQYALYDQFHLDEPWDSPHNLSLVEKMPRDFESPDVQLERGHTLYLAVSGEKFVFGNEKKRVTLEGISDGTSRTIGLVEANPERAVIWTKPEDFEVDLENPGQGLGGIRSAGFNVAMLDGSIQLLPKQIDPKILLQLFDPRNGQ